MVAAVPELLSRSEEGFADLLFACRSVEIDDEGSGVADLAAEHNGALVGIRLRWSGQMRPGMNGADVDRTAFYASGVVLEHSGPQSDRLLEVLGQVYGVRTTGEPMRDRIPLTSFALGGDPREIQSQPVKFKVFHDDEDEFGEYAELYVNMDLVRGEVELREKDPDYRPYLIKALQPRLARVVRCTLSVEGALINPAPTPDDVHAACASLLSPDGPEFVILDRPGHGYAQCASTEERVSAVEWREYQEEGFVHWKLDVGQPTLDDARAILGAFAADEPRPSAFPWEDISAMFEAS